MEFHTCGHLKQDGVFCNSPALRGRSSRYFDFNLRGRRLNHANPEPNSLRLNILPASLTGSIFCADFRLSPPVFSIFYEQGGGGEGGSIRLSAHRDSRPIACQWLTIRQETGSEGSFEQKPTHSNPANMWARGCTHATGEVVEEKSGAPGRAPSHGGGTGRSH